MASFRDISFIDDFDNMLIILESVIAYNIVEVMIDTHLVIIDEILDNENFPKRPI